MAADNWATCPQCMSLACATREMLVQKLAAGYGKLPEEEYIALREKVALPISLKSTLREDWDIGISPDGRFEVSYRASCDVCGFQYEYDHQDVVST